MPYYSGSTYCHLQQALLNTALGDHVPGHSTPKRKNGWTVDVSLNPKNQITFCPSHKRLTTVLQQHFSLSGAFLNLKWNFTREEMGLTR